MIEGGSGAARQGAALCSLWRYYTDYRRRCYTYCVQVLRAKESHAAAAASGRAHTVVQEVAEQTALRDN